MLTSFGDVCGIQQRSTVLHNVTRKQHKQSFQFISHAEDKQTSKVKFRYSLLL